jgi:hypothetical protein
MNRKLMEKARFMLSGVEFGQEFEEEEVGTVCYLVNLSCSSTLNENTLHEVWSGKKPSLTYLRVFGCHAYVHIPEENMSKL